MSSTEPTKPSWQQALGPRQYIGIAIAIYSLALIAVNWREETINFVFFQVETPLTVALALVFVGGMATGAMLIRRRAKKQAEAA